VWALSRLMRADEFAALRATFHGRETDAGVLAEWARS
jgi:hypothetical protein